MPPTQRLMTASLQFGELPIFPFLAPRVFKPWPNWLRSRKRHRSASSQMTVVHGSDVENERQSMSNSGTILPNNGQLRSRNPYNTELGNRDHSESRNISMSANSGEIHAGEDRFRSVYEDVWGSELAVRRFRRTGSLMRKDIKAKVSAERMEAINHKSGSETRSAERTLTKPPARTLPSCKYGLEKRHLSSRNPAVESRKPRPLLGKETRLAFVRTWRPDRFSSLWAYRSTRLDSGDDSQMGSDKISRGRSPLWQVATGVKSFATELRSASVQEIEEAWEALPRTEREIFWIQIMLYALGSNPEWALKFLIATDSKSDAPSYAIRQSLEHFVSHRLRGVEPPDTGIVEMLFRTVIGFLDYFDPHCFTLTQKTIYLILSHSSIIQVEHLYRTLVQKKHLIRGNTLLHFAHTFARNRRTQLAVGVLRKFREDGGDFAQPKVESICATLLQLKNRSSSDNVIPDSEIFSLLLDLGLRPNIIIYNILIKNAVDLHDSGTAWQIHDMLPTLGISASASTYSVLLNDAKLRRDRPVMRRIVGIVESKTIANEYIITDILHAMFLAYEEERRDANTQNPSPAPLKGMLPLYAEYFDLEPIREILPKVYSSVMPRSNRPKMHPPTETLVVILIALLRGFTDPSDVPRWYRHFRTMLFDGHPDIVHLAKSTHIYDAVIMCLGRWPSTLHLCTEVIGDMLSSYSATRKPQVPPHATERENTIQVTASLPQNPNSEESQEWDSGIRDQALNVALEEHSVTTKDKSPKLAGVSSSEGSRREHTIIHGHCKPSVRTWSILLKAFMDNNQPRAAEKVFNMMRRTGITANQVTWNSLATGYARLQDITNTVDVIERLEDEGYHVDEITTKGLQAIEDREALMEALQEKARRQKRRQMKQLEPSKTVDHSIDLCEPGGLDDVIEWAQRADLHEESPFKPRPTPNASRTPSERQPEPLHLLEDELEFTEMPRPTLQAVDDVPADLPSMQAQPV